ncbi:MAG TPA: AAA family ATPase [Streptosporangiaceae bacterium]|nr:AAA family ATPase [Streptosporangiaceae bacterium]
MRLHRLRLAAFGPYAAEQVVDFDRLAHGGLFLLEGPTGAGKSTILDAVTFALYGGLAGEDPAEDRLRSHFAAAEARTEVELVWSLRGVRYKVTRGPEYRRPKRRGDGFTTEASRVHLQRRDGAAWASLSANKAEAGELIAELVGLTRAQFTQVMLLPQGEFARFLRSSDDLRRGLLSKLFGTSLYDRITEDLCARRTEATRARDQAGRAISIAVSAAAEAAGLDAGESAELLAAARAERQTQLKELDESLAQAIAATGAALAAAAGSLSAAQAEEEEARRQAGLMTRLTTALADLRAHQGTRPGHDERAARLALARHAEPVRPLLEVLAEAVAAVEAATGDLADLRPEPDAAALAGRDGAAAAARAEAAEAEAAGLQHGAEAEQGLPGREAELGRLEHAAAGAQERVAALERARQEFPDRVTTLETRLAEAGALAAGLGTAAQQLGAVRRRGDAAALLAGLEPRLAGLNAARVAAIEAHHRLVDEHQHLLDARLAGIAAELAAALAEGGPCPVCGSPAHPSPALACASAVSAEEVEEARQRRESADAERDRAEREHAALAIEAAGCEATSGGQSVAALADEADALARQVAQAEAAAQEAAGLEREIADARAEQEHVGTELREAAEAAAAARAQAGRAAADLAVLRAEVQDAAQGHESVAARQAALRSAAARDRALAAALDRVTACAAAEAAARARAAAEARAQGFATADAAAQAVLTSQGQAALAAEVRSWEERLGLLTAAAQAPDLAGLDPGGAQQAAARAAEAAAALARARDAERAAREASLGAARRAERFAQRSGDVRAVEDDYDRVAEATEAVVRLASLANGTEGHRRVALTTYVLRHWFGQVVAAANARLSAMSSGRYELRRTDEGKTRRDRSGLTLAVIDRHTGEERSPASLSGGETFYTSLALALGLADIVRAEAGGVDLDTLFIDEGFGSLDSGTLDQVMGVIDELRDRGRVIGIVSHVADLKERVPERLEVRRLPDGSSAVRVVA